MKSYKELDVWQKAVSLAIDIYKIAEKFPHSEKFGLTSQIQRAVTSVPANIAEGWGRGSTKEYIQFLHIARGSLLELETHVIIAQKLDYLSNDQLNELSGSIEGIAKMLNRLINTLKMKL
ncbi:MAG: four helix bundle protein [Proteobacteria bacterium]|jgi:four helix bundle protein|nr:four helix bundle protein [Pseudomonadota bacterium]